MDHAASHGAPLPLEEAYKLNKIDDQITEIMLSGERICSRKNNQCQSWSPWQRKIARTYSYWRQKLIMANKKFFRWDHLDQLRNHTSTTDQEHEIRDYDIIRTHVKQSRDKWKACKKRSDQICRQFLEERASFFASKLRCTEEKALRAII
jgi:hypothetical protein